MPAVPSEPVACAKPVALKRPCGLWGGAAHGAERGGAARAVPVATQRGKGTADQSVMMISHPGLTGCVRRWQILKLRASRGIFLPSLPAPMLHSDNSGRCLQTQLLLFLQHCDKQAQTCFRKGEGVVVITLHGRMDNPACRIGSGPPCNREQMNKYKRRAPPLTALHLRWGEADDTQATYINPCGVKLACAPAAASLHHLSIASK